MQALIKLKILKLTMLGAIGIGIGLGILATMAAKEMNKKKNQAYSEE